MVQVAAFQSPFLSHHTQKYSMERTIKKTHMLNTGVKMTYKITTVYQIVVIQQYKSKLKRNAVL